MRKRLGDTLISWGVLTPEHLDQALAAQAADSRTTHRRLGKVLLDQGLVSEWTLACALGDMHGLPAVDVSSEYIDEAVARRVPQSVALKYLVMPMWEREGTLRVAVADPLDVVAVDDLRLRMPKTRFEFVVAAESPLRDRIIAVWREVRNRAVMDKFAAAERPAPPIPERILAEADDHGAVAAVNDIFATAVRSGASDIHIEPGRSAVTVRMRIDGQLREMMTLPRDAHFTVVARMKIVSSLDVVERRVPQDGRAHITVDGAERNLRISTLPTLHGEKLVVRLLSSSQSLPELADLGMLPGHAEMLRRTLRLPQGLVLVTGPTGAGKSTTLYSAINEVLDTQRNVISIEDPVEVELPGVSQVQVSERTGMTFATSLRAALRQDPDVIVVGEIRDSETAELAVRASLTGHLVVSTVHTLDAPSAVVRLAQMGIPGYLLGPAIVLSLAQRLVRRPCPACLGPDLITEEMAHRLRLTPDQVTRLVAGSGCRDCAFTGFRGRLGIYEVLAVGERLRELIVAGEIGQLNQVAAREGWKPLIVSGVGAALAGLTTAAELLRVLSTRIDDVDALNSAIQSG